MARTRGGVGGGRAATGGTTCRGRLGGEEEALMITAVHANDPREADAVAKPDADRHAKQAKRSFDANLLACLEVSVDGATEDEDDGGDVDRREEASKPKTRDPLP